MTIPQKIYLLFFIVLIISGNIIAQTSLPHSTPETEGVSPQGIINFINAANKSKTEFHSFMLLRHGKVIAEGWWNPYDSTCAIHYIHAVKVLQQQLLALQLLKTN